MKRFVALISLVVTASSSLAGSVLAGNGAPSGAHYNLNIIGVARGKTADMTGTQGHTIFVPLWGTSKIWLNEGDYEVTDRNGTDPDGAAFSLPNPDPDGDGVTEYSVFARALGRPGGKSYTTTCATDLATGIEECSLISLELVRVSGPSKFTNVSKYLLYMYLDTDGDGRSDTRVPLFGDGYEDFSWEYNNQGLKLAQLRFYECASTVPAATDPNGPTTDNCGRTGN